MNQLRIYNGLDLRAQSMAFLQQQFVRAGPYYFWIARGVDERPVRPNRIRKSVGAENTFATDWSTLDAARAALQRMSTRFGGIARAPACAAGR